MTVIVRRASRPAPLPPQPAPKSSPRPRSAQSWVSWGDILNLFREAQRKGSKR
jgi:hypothetical protein